MRTAEQKLWSGDEYDPKKAANYHLVNRNHSERSLEMLTPGKCFPEREGLLEKHSPREARENRRYES